MLYPSTLGTSGNDRGNQLLCLKRQILLVPMFSGPFMVFHHSSSLSLSGSGGGYPNENSEVDNLA